ncbi:TonB family protein [Edaphobacter aggregans]|uniref:TonB family protein n=1 Tax=Edaphobacter aggregans TaxID=570835 RepID=A0A428ME41_9BACT|nr:energy transducer TonB [Edaphobacter aggregans]RSL15148.1 TonB family protein [Edaphobacter aggregans]
MSFFSNAQETFGRYGGYIAEFQELFGKHEVSFGTPKDFLQLAPKLAYDEKFRLDFAKLTKSTGQRAAGRLTLTRMLTIIAIAIAGLEIESLEKNAVSISLVVVFLAGIGGWCEAESEGVPTKVEQIASKREETKGGIAVVANEDEESEEKEALELEHRLSRGPQSDLEGLTASLFGGPAVKEALSRLELNTLELKLHLDSIDHRMERIEPHLDDLTARISSTAESLPRAETNGRSKLPAQRFSQTELMEPRSGEQAIAGRGVEVAKIGMVVAPATWKQAEPKQLRRLYWVLAALGVLLFVLASAAGVFFYRGRRQDSGESRVAAAVAATGALHDGVGGTHGLDPPGRGGGNGAAGPGLKAQEKQEATARQAEKLRVLAAAGQGGQGSSGGLVSGPDRNGPNQTGQNYMGPGNRPLTGVRTEFGNQPGKIHVAKVDAPPPVVANGSSDAPRMTAGLGAVASARSPSILRAGPDVSATAAKVTPPPAAVPPAAPPTSKAVFVSASTLTRYVIAAPKPTYPQVAHFQRTEGDVMVRALIAEDGKIENVTAVSGPAGLQQAAVDAMRNWRYRPYLMNGKAVEVMTYINFHFSMEH